MDSIRKDRFKRSLLSSAILISIQGFTSTASAATCPPPELGNIQIAQGNYCNDGLINDGVSIDDASLDSVLNLEAGIIRTDGTALMVNGSTISQNIENSGVIRGINGSGIVIESSLINGNLQNNAVIEGSITGIHLKGDTYITGGINNDGFIIAGSNPDDLLVSSGISLEGNSTVGTSNKGITNTGIINVQSGIEHDSEAFYDGAQANGIQVIDNADSGRIENYGDIIADTYGIYVRGTTIDGSIVNYDSGVIQSGDNGIYLDDARVTGSVTSSGQVISTNDNAIDFENATVGSSVVVSFLTSHPDYDALSIDDSTIGGSVISQAPMGPLPPDTITIRGEDGLDIDDTTIGGAVIASGNMEVVDEGVDFDRTKVSGAFVNTGIINAGRTGISIEGRYEEPNGEEPFYNSSIGGVFDNSGVINAGENGIDINRTQFGGAIRNTGDIQSETGTAIKLSAISSNGSFYNAGNLSADTELRYGAGDYYLDSDSALVIEGGQLSLIPGGVDGHNEAWFVVINQGLEGQRVQLQGAGGFSSEIIEIEPGQILFINAGSHQADANNYQLVDADTQVELLAETALNEPFNPREIEATQRGIAISGHYYDDGELELANHTEIGGTFENKGTINAYDEAIHLDNTTVRGDFINRGDLTSIDSHGISLQDNVSILGGFLNEGIITALDDGIHLSADIALNGSFVNRGDITVGPEASAIYISDSTIAGNIENYGTLTQLTEETGEDDYHGLYVNESEVEGSILNYGNITVQGTEGIYILDSQINGSVYNDTNVTIDAYSDAIIIEDSDILHQLNDDDSIAVRGDLINHATLVARNHDGIDINQTDIDGDVINTGAITSGDNALELDGEFEDSSDENIEYMVIKGSLINEGTLTTREADEDSDRDGNGFDMDYVDIRTNLTNSGNINSIHHGFLIEKSIVGGNFSNTGTLTVAQSGIVLEGLEPQPAEIRPVLLNEEEEAALHRVDIGGYFYNSGTISAGQAGIVLDRVDIGTSDSSEAGAGNFENHGNIEVIHGSAIDINDTSIAGNVINTGELSADEPYIYQPGDSYRQDWEGKPGNGESPYILEAAGTDNQGNQWFKVRLEQMYGSGFPIILIDESREIIFSGESIDAGEEIYINAGQQEGDVILAFPPDFQQEGLAQASPDDNLFEPEYDSGNGILVTDSRIGGGFINSGTIKAYHSAIRLESVETGNVINSAAISSQESGIELNDVIVQGGVENSGNISSGDKGITIIDSQLNGSVTNTKDGIITVTDGRDGIELRNINGITDFINAGTITLDDTQTGGDGMSADKADMSGVMANTGTITAGYGMLMTDSSATGFINDGTINSYYEGMTALAASDEAIISIDGDIGVGSEGVINSIRTSGISLSSVQNVHGIINNGAITAGTHGIKVSGVSAESVYNNGSISAGNYVEEFEDGETDSSGSGIYLSESNLQGNIINDVDGQIQATTHGIYLGETHGATNIHNEGSITVGTDGIKLSGSTLNRIEEDNDFNSGNIINYRTGTITAGDDAIRIGGASYLDDGMDGLNAIPSHIEGDIANMGTITADENAIDIDDSVVSGIVSNSGTITSGDVTIDIGGEDSFHGPSVVNELVNSGTLTSENGAVIRVADSSLGSIKNTGTLNGGQVSGDEMDTQRIIADGSIVALDFRTATQRLDLFNGAEYDNTGVINGDIYGSTSSDRIELAAGELNGDIYDVESIDITGSVAFNNDILSDNNSSTLRVAEDGTLNVGVNSTINLQGDYIQNDTLAVVLNENSHDLTIPRIDASGPALFNEGSTIRLSVEDRNIANFNPGFAGSNVHLVHADSGVTDNGVNLLSDSILFNYTPFGNESTEFGVIGTVTDLGTVASNGGASTNAANAITAFQGDNSEGLVNLYTSNPDLYNAIYDADLTGLVQLAELLIAGNPGNSIAASQNAQNEAINTILNRIADLRSGASGISAGDREANYLRPDSLWIRAIFSNGDQKKIDENDGYSLRIKGFTIGADRDINDYLTLGLGMTMVTSTANQANADSETDSYLGSLYAGWRNQDYFVDANLNLGSSKTDISIANWDTQYNANQLALSVLAGKSFLFNNNDSLIEPSIGVNFTRLKSDSYSYGSTDVGATSLQSLELGAGIRYMTSFDMGTGQLLPEVSLMAWHDFKAEAVETEIGFENSGGSFTYFGPEAVKNRYQASAGVEYWMDNNFTLSLNYDHNWQTGFKADTVQAKLRYDF